MASDRCKRGCMYCGGGKKEKVTSDGKICIPEGQVVNHSKGAEERRFLVKEKEKSTHSLCF